ncbi:MAG: hypothetical protein HUU46_15680 [Candidatus Hydrogenedentes bacterium]|nr:hypothetical protein [Candidatus Hydrogenedentota bacterium]
MPDTGPLSNERSHNAARNLFRAAFFLGVLAAGSGVGYALWEHIRLPFRNPLNVIGDLARQGFNPANNQVRFAVFVLMPSVLLLVITAVRVRALNRLLFSRESPPDSNDASTIPRALRIAIVVVFVVFSGLVSLTVPTYHASGTFDTFHEGESLGTAVSLEHGKAPYRDVIFLHGLFQDPYRSLLAFKLFGRSIGSVRTLESALKVIGWVLLAAVIFVAFEGDYRLAIPALCILALMQREFSTFFYRHLIDKSYVCYPRLLLIFPPRDVLLMASLLASAALFESSKAAIPKSFAIGPAGFILAFISLGAFAYSIERGLYLSVSFVFAVSTVYYLVNSSRHVRVALVAGCVLGAVAATALLGTLLQGQFGAFIDFVFLTMPRYKELSDGHIYPIAFSPYLRVTIVYAAIVLWMCSRFIGEVYNGGGIMAGLRAFVKQYFIECHLLVISLLYVRNATGRADWEHVAYSLLPISILALVILGKHIARPILAANRSRGVAYAALAALALACLCIADDARRSRHLEANFPYRIADAQFVDSATRETVAYLKSNLGPGESVFTLTSEASWYYLLNQPAPTRFPVLWFATPDIFQREIIEDLKVNNVKYLIYRGKYPLIDDIPHEERYPILMDFVRTHYRPHTAIEGTEIWVRAG